MTFPSTKMLVALVAVLGSGGLQAANLLTASPGTIALTCNTLTGPGTAATIVITPVATLTSNSVPVAAQVVLGTGLIVTAPSPATLNSGNQAQGLTYTVNLAAGCVGAVGTSATIRFYAAGVADVGVTASVSVVATTSPLTASAVTLTCSRNISYTPGPAQTVVVTSSAAGGTFLTVDPASLPSWVTVTPINGGNAGATGVTLTVSPAAPCGNFPVGSSNTISIHLKNAPAPDGLIPVTLQILGTSPVTAAPGAPSLTYVKGSAVPSSVDVAFTVAGSTPPAFAVDPSSMPPWLSVDVAGGTAPKTLRFSTTSVAESIAPGTYGALVHVEVSGYADLAVPFSLTVSNAAPKLTVEEGTTRNFSWTQGQALAVLYVTLASSGSTIPYTLSTAGDAAPIVAAGFLKGLAYSYGTPIPVTFNPNVFAAAQPGSVSTGTVTVTWGNPATATVVTMNIAIQSAGATLLGVSPLSVPTAPAGETFTVALIGSGFVASSDAAQRTQVGIVSGGQLVADANLAATVVNSSNLIVVITVPAKADPLLPFDESGTGGNVTLGVCNPLGSACATATGAATLAIGAIPVVQGVTSASTYLQVTPPVLATVAPYDIVSVFGFNFCDPGGAGCGDGILYGTLDPVTLRYPTNLSPDPAGATRRLLTVAFQTHATSPVTIASAPLLFATDEQINLLVPAAVTPFIGKPIDIVVNFGAVSSAPFAVNVAAADPGIFTVGADGRGEGAILALDWSMVTAGNEAGMRQNAADSDTVQIYGTGWGSPDATADNAAAGAGLWPSDCVTTSSLLNTLNLQTGNSLTTVDGILVSGGLLNAGRLAPCLGLPADIPSVTIGGQPATVTYAGWVAGSVAGQYQVNVRLPGSAVGPFTTAAGAVLPAPLASAVQLPVLVTVRGRVSQSGVTMWVAPRLKVTGPAGLQGKAGVVWAGLVTASEGTVPYQYAVSAGSLPGGLTLNAATGAIAGTPDTAGSYPVTISAGDAAATPVTGSITFTIVVAGK